MKVKIFAIIGIPVLALAFLAIAFFKNDVKEVTGHENHDNGPGEHVEAIPAGEVDLADWCAEHRVPESECTICNPALIESFKAKTYMGKSDWCEGHNLPESHCRLCNHGISFPQETALADVNDWCAEHAVPESVCTLCNAGLIEAFKAKGDWCPEHGIPESNCRICNPGIVFPQELALARQNETFEIDADEIKVELFYRKNSPVCATNGALIQFASAETVNRAGLSTRMAFSEHLSNSIEAPAETKFDETHLTVVTISVPALVTKWMVSAGDEVKKNSVLAILSSPDIARIQASLLTAHSENEIEKRELERFEELKSKNLVSQSEYDRQLSDSKRHLAELTSARGQLSSAGMSAGDIDEIISGGVVSNQILLRAPDKGIVVERKAQLGELLSAGNAFAVLADPNSMWIEASVSEEQIRNISVGQMLTFTSDGQGLNRIGGKVIWVARHLDAHTRTGIVRAEIVGDAGRFQSGEFGHVKFASQVETDVTLVPKDAVQWEGCCNVVFVKESQSRYRPRKVSLAEGNGPFYQILNGVKPGEEVVVDGAFLLKTELKKSSIGAGCCGLEPAG